MDHDSRADFKMKKQAGSAEDRMEEHEKKESFWKYLSKILCTLAMFKAINKHY